MLKMRLDVSCFSMKIKDGEYLSCILSSFWLPSMGSSISFWTNCPLQMIPSYVLISGTKLSVVPYFLPLSFLKITLFAVLLDMKVRREAVSLWTPNLLMPTKVFFSVCFVKESPRMPPRQLEPGHFTLTSSSSLSVGQAYRVLLCQAIPVDT